MADQNYNKGMVIKMRVLNWLNRNFELALIATGLGTMVIVMTAQIFMRTFLGTYLSWSEELCRHIFICVGFWGLSLTIHENSAIKFDLLLMLFSKQTQRWINIFADIFMICFFLYILRSSISLAITMQSSAATMLPYSMGLIYWIVVAALIITIIRLIQELILKFKQRTS